MYFYTDVSTKSGSDFLVKRAARCENTYATVLYTPKYYSVFSIVSDFLSAHDN